MEKNFKSTRNCIQSIKMNEVILVKKRGLMLEVVLEGNFHKTCERGLLCNFPQNSKNKSNITIYFGLLRVN